jgi:hypothetical protein
MPEQYPSNAFNKGMMVINISVAFASTNGTAVVYIAPPYFALY